MLPRIDLRGRAESAAVALPRASVDVATALADVQAVVDDVRNRGITAVRDATERFDGVSIDDLRVSTAALHAALESMQPDLRRALKVAAERVRLVATAQLRDDVDVEVAAGARVRERWRPVRRAGVYVPGGRVAYPSSVVMNVVPARVAGVEQIVVASPPRSDGLPHPSVLAACALLGIDEVYRVGGAQAIAMLAYGVDGCPAVDVVTGPGNVYVAAAKRLVRGVVGTDGEAGPTEIAIVADESADPVAVAADLIAQAEHDPLAACLLVSPSVSVLDAVDVALGKQVPATPHREWVESALTGQSAGVLVDDIDAAVEVVDEWAPEHLEIVTANPAAVADRVRSAGAIFVGAYAPVSLGDYLAGSNHVLPTGGTARHSGGLSPATFLRVQHVVEFSRDALADVAPHIEALGAAEDLGAHVEAVKVRLT